MNHQTSALQFPALWGGYVVNTSDDLKNYFVRLTSREGLEVELHDNTIICQNITDENYIVTGIYSFKFVVDGALLAFPSRFTFVINLNLDKPILHHHSSQIPRNLS